MFSEVNPVENTCFRSKLKVGCWNLIIGPEACFACVGSGISGAVGWGSETCLWGGEHECASICGEAKKKPVRVGSIVEPESHRGVLSKRERDVLRDLRLHMTDWWILNLLVLSLRCCGQRRFHCQRSCGKGDCCALWMSPSGHGSHKPWWSKSPTNYNDRKKEKS